MPDFPSPVDVQQWASAGAQVSVSAGTTVTSGGSAHTKGSYVEFFAATAVEAHWFLFVAGSLGTPTNDYMFDIAVGAAGSEQVIAANLYITGLSSHATNYYLIPVFIPAGSRVAVRVQSTGASSGCRCMIYIGEQGFIGGSPMSECVTYGVDTADTGGVQVDPGGSANTKGAWSEIVASTGADVRWLVFVIGDQASAARASCVALVDVGIGAAGSEVIVAADLYLVCTTTGDVFTPWAFMIPIFIPAGTRIAARAQCSITTSPDRLFDVMIYGVS